MQIPDSVGIVWLMIPVFNSKVLLYRYWLTVNDIGCLYVFPIQTLLTYGHGERYNAQRKPMSLDTKRRSSLSVNGPIHCTSCHFIQSACLLVYSYSSEVIHSVLMHKHNIIWRSDRLEKPVRDNRHHFINTDSTLVCRNLPCDYSLVRLQARPLPSCGVRPSVCLSRSCIVSKQVNIISNFFHYLVDPAFHFSAPNVVAVYRGNSHSP